VLMEHAFGGHNLTAAASGDEQWALGALRERARHARGPQARRSRTLGAHATAIGDEASVAPTHASPVTPAERNVQDGWTYPISVMGYSRKSFAVR
jgi:hypothetical protein